MLRPIFLTILILLSSIVASAEAPLSKAPDLNPVTFHDPPHHDPIILIADGQARATLCLMGQVDDMAVQELQRCLKLATGTELPILKDQIKEPALVIGDSPDAPQAIAGGKLPPEGLAIATAPNRVQIVGNGPGLSWAIYEFLERYLGARWYFVGDTGRYVPQSKTLAIPPVYLTDVPIFRKRELWPVTSNPQFGNGTDMRALHQALRSYDSSPIRLQVHTPNYADNEDYRKNRPEIFQMTQSGGRDYEMLCYSNPRTLQTYLENIQKRLDGDNSVNIGLIGDTITICPNDANIACFCPDCRKLWDDQAGAEGCASKIVATFTQKLATEVKKRWPNLKVIQLAYVNYTTCPEGIEFPDNVYIQICGMPGMALYSQPAIFDAEQANLDKWFHLTGPARKVQNWLYICWPQDRTSAVFAYPHALQKYYQTNRDKIVGSFINGSTDHWPRQGLTLYCWLKLLWNPDFNLDAAIDAYAKNMYGPAAAPMRKLIQLQLDGWEKITWPKPVLTARNVYTRSYPRPIREQMKQLLEQARKDAALSSPSPVNVGADPRVRPSSPSPGTPGEGRGEGSSPFLQRINYYAAPFPDFFREGAESDNTAKRTPLTVPQASSPPVIDGRLDDPCWSTAAPVSFIPAIERDKKQVQYPTTLRAVWTDDGEAGGGVTFAFDCSDPNPDRIRHGHTGRDTPDEFWWDDCVELLFDPTGQNDGDYYHFIVTASGAFSDAHTDDLTFNATGARAAAQITSTGWTLELFLPFNDFPASLHPTADKPATWFGNFTRHRVADRFSKTKIPGSVEEYQRLNTTFAGPSNNLADFGPIILQQPATQN